MNPTASKARAKSCIECRQHKIRCDLPSRHPASCSRCERRSLPCTYQASFVREQRRQRQLRPKSSEPDEEAEFEDDGLASSSLRQSPSSQIDPMLQEPSGSQTVRHPSFSLLQQPRRRPSLLLELPQDSSVTLESVTLSSDEVNQYFRYFFDNMHCHFQFLDEPFDINKTLATSPLLFWTILTISSGVKSRSLYRQIQGPLRRLLSSWLFPFRPSQEACQALCLLCLWPLDAENPNDDPYYAFAGFATHMAAQIGLHRPDFIDEFKGINRLKSSNPRVGRDRAATWLATVYVEHHLATKVGVASSTRSNWSLQQILNDPNTYNPPLSTSVRHQVLLAKLRDKFMEAIAWDGQNACGLCEPVTRLNLLNLFTDDLDQFVARTTDLDVFTSILLHSSHVTVAGLTLASDLLALETHATDKAQLLHRGITSAIAVLDCIAPLAWETLPVHVLRSILHAGIFIAQLLRAELQTEKGRGPSPGEKNSLSPGTWLPWTQRSSPSGSRRSNAVLNLTQEELKRLLVQLDRAIDVLRSVSYGRDFATRGKIVLESIRSHFLVTGEKSNSPLVLHITQEPEPDIPWDSGSGNGELVLDTTGSGPFAMGNTSNSASASVAGGGTGGANNIIGVGFRSRMGANIYWDAVEFGKERQNWAQNERDILSEMMSTGTFI